MYVHTQVSQTGSRTDIKMDPNGSCNTRQRERVCQNYSISTGLHTLESISRRLFWDKLDLAALQIRNGNEHAGTEVVSTKLWIRSGLYSQRKG